MATFAIVGAGFSGTLLALHLLRRTPTRVRVVLIERQNRFAQGPAYATGNPSHVLNVPAGRMSAFHDRPEDFFEWLARQPDAPAEFGPGSFAPRRQFGAYIRQLLHEELKRPGAEGRLELVRGDVAAIETEPHGPLSLCIGDRRIEADLAVLAVGNFPPEPPSIADHAFYDTTLYRPDPWAGEALAGLDPHAPVLLIGTGLTMVDTVTSLEDAGHLGPIHALSRRGLTPRCHATAAKPPRRPGAAIPDRLTDCVKMLRGEARRAVRDGSTWQAALDELRPFGRDLWQNLSPSDRSRFLRHLRPWWDVHRHRLAPDVSCRIDAARARGQLHIHAGRIDSIVAEDDGMATVAYRPRGSTERRELRVARVVNCAGPACDFDRIAHPLVRRLLADGMVRPDAHRLGLDVTPSGALKDRQGAISRQLFAVGPVTRGAFWEMTAVPDIRRQCELLAAQLAMLV